MHRLQFITFRDEIKRKDRQCRHDRDSSTMNILACEVWLWTAAQDAIHHFLRDTATYRMAHNLHLKNIRSGIQLDPVFVAPAKKTNGIDSADRSRPTARLSSHCHEIAISRQRFPSTYAISHSGDTPMNMVPISFSTPFQ
jgi:hypothetical protein